VHFGAVSNGIDVGTASNIVAKELKEPSIYSTASSNELTVKELLCPLEDTPIIRGIGSNYHSALVEAAMSAPKYPGMFFKSRTAMTGPGDVVLPKICQDGSATYEGEVCVIMGKDALNVTEEDALSYVFGVSCSNDITVPKLMKTNAHGCFSKSMDKCNPIGPSIVPLSEYNLKDARLRTLLNNKVVQDGNINDLVFNVPQLIAYLSQGQTIEKDSIITLGTPAGILSRWNPPSYLKDGDEVRVIADGIGTLVNRIVYET